MIEVMEITIIEKETNGTKFYCVEIDDTRSTHRIWVNPSYYKKELEGKIKEYFLGVFRNARIEKTQKGNLVIKQGNNNVFLVRVKCGYRGESSFEVLSNSINVYKFYYKHSPNGSLGISEMGLIETAKDYIKIEWKRSGRLYGNPSRGVSVIKVDGSIEDIPDISDQEIEEILAE